MPNPTPNTSGLDKSPWVNKPVKVYRLPEPIADDVLAYAHKLDKGNGDRTTEPDKLDAAINILTNALTLPANKGGAIKAEIKKVIEALSK